MGEKNWHFKIAYQKNKVKNTKIDYAIPLIHLIDVLVEIIYTICMQKGVDTTTIKHAIMTLNDSHYCDLTEEKKKADLI